MGEFWAPGAEIWLFKKKNMDRSIDLAVWHMYLQWEKTCLPQEDAPAGSSPESAPPSSPQDRWRCRFLSLWRWQRWWLEGCWNIEPDGSVLDDQLGDLVGPEHIPVQPLHVAVHNRQVFYLAPGSKKKKVQEQEEEEKKTQKDPKHLRRPTAMLARLVFSQSTAMPWIWSLSTRSVSRFWLWSCSMWS